MPWRHGAAALAALCLLGATAGRPAGTVALAPVSVSVEGTEFKAVFADGRVLRSPQLAGVVLSIAVGGRMLRLRIDDVIPDPGDSARGVWPSTVVWLHHFSVEQADGSWAELCEAGPDGRRDGFPLAGRAEADATLGPGAPGEFTIACTGGAQGKCVRLGYHPWENLPGGAPMLPVYNACIRLVRADYSGDGVGTTRNGQLIDIYDGLGIQVAANDPHQEFEAGWTADGAVCVRHVRVKDKASLAGIAAASPRLAGRVGAVCTEAFARAAGAVLFDRSAP